MDSVLKKRIIKYCLIILAVVLVGIAIAVLTRVPVPAQTQRMIALYTRNKPYAQVSVAYISPDGVSTKTFTHNGKKHESSNTDYEIGAITNTFTGAMIARAVLAGDISLETPASEILPLPSGAYSPTVGELVTHTSGYADYVPAKFGGGNNPWSGITNFDILYDMANFELLSEPPFVYSYSDFGSAAAGAVLGDLYSEDYYRILNDFVHLDLGLKNTYVTVDRLQMPKNGWKWMQTDAYIAPFGLTSNMTDMVSYVRMYLNGGMDYLNLAVAPLKEINNETDAGYFWDIDRESGYIFQSGETDHYSAYIIMDPDSGCAAIVLSNYKNDKYGSAGDIARAVLEAHGQF